MAKVKYGADPGGGLSNADIARLLYQQQQLQGPKQGGDYDPLGAALERPTHPVYSIGQGLADMAGQVGSAYFQREREKKLQAIAGKNNAALAGAYQTATNPNLAQDASGNAVAMSPNGQMASALNQQTGPVPGSPGMQYGNVSIPADLAGAAPVSPEQRAHMAIQSLGANGALAQQYGPSLMQAAQSATPKQEFHALGAEGGIITDSRGNVVKQLAGKPQKDPNELTTWQKEQLERTDRRFEQQDRSINNAQARADASEERRRHPQSTPYVSRVSGAPVRLDPTTGNYMDGESAIQATDLVPAADYNKDVEAARNIVGKNAQVSAIKDAVKNNPDAFKTSKVLAAQAKGLINDKWAANEFTPEQRKVRAQVAQDSAAIINELYGAALSAGENKRAETFAPGPNDDIDQLLPKLDAAVSWGETKKGSLLPSAVKAAERQLAQPQANAAPGGKIKVRKGNEILEIDPADADHAKADGYEVVK